MVYRLCFVAALFLLLLGGCKSYGPWHELADRDAPWVGPDQQVTTLRRSVNPAPFIVAALPDQRAWVDLQGRKVSPAKISRRVETFLAEHGNSLVWEATGRSVDGVEQRRTPYTLTLVSIYPAVILMTPHDDAPSDRDATRLSTGSGLPWSHTKSFPANVLRYGVRAPHADGMFWFSPDLSEPPQPLITGGNTAEILLPSGKLHLSRDESQWTVMRLR